MTLGQDSTSSWTRSSWGRAEMPHRHCLSHPRDGLAAHRGQRVRLCDVGSRAAGLTRKPPQRAPVPGAGPEPARTFRTGPRCFSLIFDKITDKTVQNSVQRSQFKPCLPWLSSDWPKQKSLWGSSRQPLPSLTPLRVLTSPHFPSCTPIPAQPRIRPSPPLLPALCPW